MGQKEKLIQKLKAKPKDFTFDELKHCLSTWITSARTKEKPVVRELFS